MTQAPFSVCIQKDSSKNIPVLLSVLNDTDSQQGMVISRNLKLGGYGQMLGGCNHVGCTNLHYKTLKKKKYKYSVGCRLSTGGVFTPPRGRCQNITVTGSKQFFWCLLHSYASPDFNPGDANTHPMGQLTQNWRWMRPMLTRRPVRCLKIILWIWPIFCFISFHIMFVRNYSSNALI